MHIRLFSLPCLAVLCLPICTAMPPAPDNIDGSWTSKGRPDILLRTTDRLLEIVSADTPTQKTVTITVVRNPGMGAQHKNPETTRFGPFKARVEPNTLILDHPSGQVRYSFSIKGDALTVPAFVRKGDREIFLEKAAVLDWDSQIDADNVRPPLTVVSWRWVFSVAPESAERGAGHFTETRVPDLTKRSRAFDFEWHWEDHRTKKHLVILSKEAAGEGVDVGYFYWDDSGSIVWIQRECCVGPAPHRAGRDYIRSGAAPATGSVVRPQP